VDSDDDRNKPDLGLGIGTGAKSGLKRLRDLTNKEDSDLTTSGRKKTDSTLTAAAAVFKKKKKEPKVMGPMLPSDSNTEKNSRSVHTFCFSFTSWILLMPFRSFLSIRENRYLTCSKDSSQASRVL